MKPSLYLNIKQFSNQMADQIKALTEELIKERELRKNAEQALIKERELRKNAEQALIKEREAHATALATERELRHNAERQLREIENRRNKALEAINQRNQEIGKPNILMIKTLKGYFSYIYTVALSI